MRQLILARHGKSDWYQSATDFDRPLNSRGEKDSQRAGLTLKKWGFKPDLVISSPANRAKSTAELVSVEVDYKLESIQFEESLYSQGFENLVRIIQNIDSQRNNVVIFGHNPTMQIASQYFLASQAAVTFPTLGMICFEAPLFDWADFSPNKLALKWFLIPKLL